MRTLGDAGLGGFELIEKGIDIVPEIGWRVFATGVRARGGAIAQRRRAGGVGGGVIGHGRDVIRGLRVNHHDGDLDGIRKRGQDVLHSTVGGRLIAKGRLGKIGLPD